MPCPSLQPEGSLGQYYRWLRTEMTFQAISSPLRLFISICRPTNHCSMVQSLLMNHRTIPRQVVPSKMADMNLRWSLHEAVAVPALARMEQDLTYDVSLWAGRLPLQSDPKLVQGDGSRNGRQLLLSHEKLVAALEVPHSSSTSLFKWVSSLWIFNVLAMSCLRASLPANFSFPLWYLSDLMWFLTLLHFELTSSRQARQNSFLLDTTSSSLGNCFTHCCVVTPLGFEGGADKLVTRCCLPPHLFVATLHFRESSDSLEARNHSNIEATGQDISLSLSSEPELLLSLGLLSFSSILALLVSTILPLQTTTCGLFPYSFTLFPHYAARMFLLCRKLCRHNGRMPNLRTS